MQRQRGELVPIGEVVADLDGPVKAIREASPQAQRAFTRFDQVNQLVSASEADASLGFMARTMALCSLPRSNPGNRKEYKRVIANQPGGRGDHLVDGVAVPDVMAPGELADVPLQVLGSHPVISSVKSLLHHAPE